MAATPSYAPIANMLRPIFPRTSMLYRQSAFSRIAAPSVPSRAFAAAACAANARILTSCQRRSEEQSGLARIARRDFSATAARAKDHHFDTLKFVQRLKDEGLTEEQAVAMMKVLSDVIEERCVQARGSFCFFL